MLREIHIKAFPFPDQPTVPWIATHLYLTDTINDPDLVSWSAALQRSIAWAIAPHDAEDHEIAESQGRTQEGTSQEDEPLLTQIIDADSVDALMRRAYHWAREAGENHDRFGKNYILQDLGISMEELYTLREKEEKRRQRNAAENHTQYITHLSLLSGHSTEAPRSELNDETLAKFRATKLKQWPPKIGHTIVTTLAPEFPEFGFRMRQAPDAHNAFVELFATRRSKKTLISFGICWSEEHAQRVWSMLEELDPPQTPMTNRPRAPWIAVHLHPLQMLQHPGVVLWAGAIEQILAWAIAPLDS